MITILLTITLWATAFLFLLNAVFGVFFRRRRVAEIMSYFVAGVIEVAIFSVALSIRLGILTHVPYHLPPNLPFNRAEIGTALALGIGLFPAAYWHRSSAAHIRARIARDAKAMKEHDAGVRVRSNTPGEWMN